MIDVMISLENLMEIVGQGGKFKAGVDVYGTDGRRLLSRKILVDRVSTLENLKKSGIRSVPVDYSQKGGLWDSSGRMIRVSPGGFIDLKDIWDQVDAQAKGEPLPHLKEDVQIQLKRILEVKEQARKTYARSRISIENMVRQIRQTKGEFDVSEARSCVGGLKDYLDKNGHGLAGLDREIFFPGEYFYTHAVNACALGTMVIRQFNRDFSRTIDRLLYENQPLENASRHVPSGFSFFHKEEMDEICFGFFLLDLGKAMVPEDLLKKKGRVTGKERKILERHSFDHGVNILEKNAMAQSNIRNIVAYHHAPFYIGETGTYPLDRLPLDIPAYVKIARLADIFDAMTSRTSYAQALNQAWALTELFRKYRHRDRVLEYILKAFVKVTGIYPPGSILYLNSGQMAYVLGGEGPLVIPFTDAKGKTLGKKPDPVDLGGPSPDYSPDTSRGIKRPKDVYPLLPAYLKKIVRPRA